MSSNPYDPFTRFWGEFVQRAGAGGMSPQPSPDTMNEMRRMFFDMMAEQADQFMRSETFLKAMKQGMEASLAWQQTLNQFMQKNLGAAQMPTRGDTDHLVLLIRGMEERLLDRIDRIGARVDHLEQAERKPAPPRKKTTRS